MDCFGEVNDLSLSDKVSGEVANEMINLLLHGVFQEEMHLDNIFL